MSNGTPTKNGKRVSLADEAANSDDSPVKMVSKKRAKFLDSDEDSRDSESKWVGFFYWFSNRSANFLFRF